MQVVPGVRLEVGQTLLEVTQYSKPCRKQESNFKSGAYARALNHLQAPGRSRVYCAVLIEGEIKAGDTVKLHTSSRGAKPYIKNPCVVGTLAQISTRSKLSNWGHVLFLVAGMCL